MDSFWTSEKEEQRQELTLQGFSASQIGDELGTTKNAVIGRNDRMKKHGGPCLKSPTKRKRYVRKVRSKPIERPSVDVSKLYDSNSSHKTLLDLEINECKWPVNDRDKDGEHLFCGHATEPDEPYCAHHAFRGTQPARYYYEQQ